jgi:6-phosphogluconate dehydrogenase
LLEDFYKAYQGSADLENILLNDTIATLLQSKEQSLRETIVRTVEDKIAAPGLMSALAYFDGYTSERMPTNLIQAQRDYFGAHTYERIDREGRFHTEWHLK